MKQDRYKVKSNLLLYRPHRSFFIDVAMFFISSACVTLVFLFEIVKMSGSWTVEGSATVLGADQMIHLRQKVNVEGIKQNFIDLIICDTQFFETIAI